MARMELRMRALGWLTRRQASVAKMTDERVIAMQRRHVPDNFVANWIFGALAPGTEAADQNIPGPDCDIPVRVYRRLRARPGPRPLIVYFHGGGFVFGSLRMGDWLCSSVAARVGAVVVSVDYRLAPAHRFPAAVEDCYAAMAWAAANAADRRDGGERGRHPVGGDVPARPRPRRARDQPPGPDLSGHGHDGDTAPG